MYQHILVPVDGSATSSRGLDEAIALARLTGGSLRILHVVDDLSVASGYEGGCSYSGDLILALRDAGAQIVAEAKAIATARGVQADTVVCETFAGRFCDLCIEQATTWPADLIVMGTHGRHGLGRAVLGSDAEQVVRLATVPVLLIRAVPGEVKPAVQSAAGVPVVV